MLNFAKTIKMKLTERALRIIGIPLGVVGAAVLIWDLLSSDEEKFHNVLFPFGVILTAIVLIIYLLPRLLPHRTKKP